MITHEIGDFHLAWDANCATGESPLWDDERRCVWFCDGPARRVLCHTPGSDRRGRFELPGPVGSLGLCRDGRLIVALRDQIVLFDPGTGASEVLADVPDVPEFARLNDGKVGPDGAFWVGGADLRPVEEKQDVCALYRITPDGRVEKKAEGFKISNGLAWSPDGAVMYHSDSRGPWIDRWDFDKATGRISDRKRFATLTLEEGRPDGAACDAAGNYWSAGVSAGCLNVFSAQGGLLAKIAVPVPTPTMPCFAPEAIFVTSLWGGTPQERLADAPWAGGLLRARTTIDGARVPRFGL
jgi:sugar lactone lactonase YvrE